jgi:hypothetical protein
VQKTGTNLEFHSSNPAQKETSPAARPRALTARFKRTYNAASPQALLAPPGSTGATMSLIKIIVITLAFILTILFFFGRLLF